ncbi:MAG: hypothetical protein HDQ88_09620 [Clostridia bacterium]|nr:hypothetical protein [Clostridia bacterium]
MSLKSSIVVVNEFTVKSQGKGTRGSTPGDYISRYMARDTAIEQLTPVRLHELDSYIKCYMAREEASEELDDIHRMKRKMKDMQKRGGVAFGNGDVSLSNDQVDGISKSIQRAFDEGKTVMKTVISFDEEYLRESGIIDEHFSCKKAGDYRGNIDQFRLREAIMAGVDRIKPLYDDLEYIGVIQVDTNNVHCHLCMVDHGEGIVCKNGTQYGKLTNRHKNRIRRGIDSDLNHSMEMARTYSNVDFSKRNVKGFVKKFALRSMEVNGDSQFLLACLPEDKRAWRASTNREDMRKANYIVREFVGAILDEPDSGYKEAVASIKSYANARSVREGLSWAETERLVEAGQDKLVEDCMNSVYSVLRDVSDRDRTVRTPMLDIMSSSFKAVADRASGDDTIEFGLKLRSYNSRLKHHKEERRKYEEQVRSYEAVQNPAPESRALYDFFVNEEEYNAKLMSKYQHFMRFLPQSNAYAESFDRLLDYKRRVKGMSDMIADPDMGRMTVDNAEQYGLRVYGQSGGKFKVIQPSILDGRLSRMQARYDAQEREFRGELAEYGLSLDSNEDGRLVVSPKPAYEFNDVKALDLHHLGYDFPRDVPVSMVNINAFRDAAYRRYELYQGARDYLVASGQERNVRFLPGKDIELMKDVADRFESTTVLDTRRSSGGGSMKHARTVRLDNDYRKDIELMVRSTVESTRMSLEMEG